MALEETSGGNGMVMPVSPMYGNGGGFGGGFGGDWGWIILLLLFAGGNFGGGFGGFGNMALGYDFPWLLNGQNGINSNVNNGFQNALLNDNVTSIRDGIGDISTQLCGGFAGVTASITGAQNAISQQLYTNQLADLERSFASQTASTQGMNNIQSQLANCCCENRLATESLRATVLQENCQDRYEAQSNTRDIIESQTRSTQAILDKLCQLELDGKNDRIAELERQLTMANLAASQTAQTSRLIADNNFQTQYIVNRVAPYPIPSYPVANPTTPAIAV